MRQSRISGMSSGCNEHKNVRSVAAPGNVCFNSRNRVSLTDRDDADTGVTFDVGDVYEDWAECGVPAGDHCT